MKGGALGLIVFDEACRISLYGAKRNIGWYTQPTWKYTNSLCRVNQLIGNGVVESESYQC